VTYKHDNDVYIKNDEYISIDVLLYYCDKTILLDSIINYEHMSFSSSVNY